MTGTSVYAVKTSLKIWGLPWKLGWNLRKIPWQLAEILADYLKFDLLRPWYVVSATKEKPEKIALQRNAPLFRFFSFSSVSLLSFLFLISHATHRNRTRNSHQKNDRREWRCNANRIKHENWLVLMSSTQRDPWKRSTKETYKPFKWDPWTIIWTLKETHGRDPWKRPMYHIHETHLPYKRETDENW